VKAKAHGNLMVFLCRLSMGLGVVALGACGNDPVPSTEAAPAVAASAPLGAAPPAGSLMQVGNRNTGIMTLTRGADGRFHRSCGAASQETRAMLERARISRGMQ
jgi:hypothetical protein